MNDTTKWIMIVLLLLLIAAAVIVLLRSPGKDRDGGSDTIDRADEDRGTVQGGREERLGAAPERGVYDQEADRRDADVQPVVDDERSLRDEPVAAPEPSTYDRPVSEDRPTVDEEPVVDEAPSQEPPASAVREQGTGVDDSVTYAEDIEATTGPEAAADRETTGDDDVTAEPYRPAAGAYEGGEPGTFTGESYRQTGADAGLQPQADVEQHPTEELTAGDTEGYGGPAPVAETTPAAGTTPEAEAALVFDEAGTDTDDAARTGADDDSDRLTEAARIGALGAAGGASAARPLTDQEVSTGARQEPLTADEVVAASGHEDGDRDGDRDRDRDGGLATAPTTGATAAGARGAGYGTEDGPDRAAEARRSEVDHADTPDSAPVFAESVYGPGSADPLDDGSGPAGWEIKGNVGSMLFHTTDSPSYDAVRAEVWFESEEAARDAGFAHWDRRRR